MIEEVSKQIKELESYLENSKSSFFTHECVLCRFYNTHFLRACFILLPALGLLLESIFGCGNFSRIGAVCISLALGIAAVSYTHLTLPTILRV